MKKYLIVLAAAVFALAGCKSGGSKYTSLKFKNGELTIAVGTTGKLQVLYEPTTLDAPVCQWSSSNTAVVTVDQNGNIEALAEGEANITAKVDDLEAVCKLTVKDAKDLVNWAGWTIWNFDEETPLTDTVVVELSIGPTKCIMYPAVGYVWDENIMPTYDGQNMDGLSGAGYVMEIMDLPIYIIKDGSKYDGYYVGSSSVVFVDPAEFNPHDTAYAYCAPAGKLGDAQKFYTYLTDTAAHISYDECITGCELSYYDWDGKKRYYWLGLVGTGVVAGDEESIYYKQNISWFEHRYGLAVVETEEGLDFKQPAEWGNIINKYYEYLPASVASKDLKPMQPIKNRKPLTINKRAITEDNKVLIRK